MLQPTHLGIVQMEQAVAKANPRGKVKIRTPFVQWLLYRNNQLTMIEEYLAAAESYGDDIELDCLRDILRKVAA